MSMGDTELGTARRRAPVGTRLALVGAVLYLLEWVAIVAAPPPGPFGPGTNAAAMVRDYADHADAAAVSAAWFAVVLGGRVLFVAGVKASVRDVPRQQALLDLALGAMAISVVLEIAAYGVAASAARLAADGGDPDVVVALDGAAFWLNLLIWGPVGLSVLATGLAMLRSRLFAAWLSWLGVVAGGVGLIGCLVAGATTDESGSGAAEGLATLAALAMWVWMLATGVVLFRQRRIDR